MVLPAAAFRPRPKVDSALVRLDVRSRPAVDLPDLDAFFRFAEQVFQFRRKQLRASLTRVSEQPAAEVARRLEEIGLDPTRRPETLSLDDWQRLYRAFSA
jgi:16S rRNA (adenine1518-N6/adenine1519-N6)-dimethyltransferase